MDLQSNEAIRRSEVKPDRTSRTGRYLVQSSVWTPVVSSDYYGLLLQVTPAAEPEPETSGSEPSSLLFTRKYNWFWSGRLGLALLVTGSEPGWLLDQNLAGYWIRTWMATGSEPGFSLVWWILFFRNGPRCLLGSVKGNQTHQNPSEPVFGSLLFKPKGESQRNQSLYLKYFHLSWRFSNVLVLVCLFYMWSGSHDLTIIIREEYLKRFCPVLPGSHAALLYRTSQKRSFYCEGATGSGRPVL